MAILMVMVFHFNTLPVTGSLWSHYQGQFATACGSGVTLFFTLSGFLITGILLNSKTDPHYLKNFYARRFLRIFPLYYVVLFAALILVPAVHTLTDAKYLYTVRHQIWLWAYLSNFYEAWTSRPMPIFGHFWSLAVEEQFYLLWPFIVLLLNRNALLWACVFCCVVAFIARLIALYTIMGPEMAAMRVTPCQIDGLAAGSLISLLCAKADTASEVLLAKARWVFGSSGLLVATLVFPLTSLPESNRLLLTGFYTLWVVFYCAGLLVAILAPPSSWIRYICETEPLRILGKYSYGLYIFHWGIGRVWIAWLRHFREEHPASILGLPWVFQGMVLLLAGGFSLFAAWSSWHLYEKHFLRFKSFFTPSLSTSSQV